MPHMQHIDELIREYLLFRGFTNALKWFDNDVKLDKDKGFRVSKILVYSLFKFEISSYIYLKLFPFSSFVILNSLFFKLFKNRFR